MGRGGNGQALSIWESCLFLVSEVLQNAVGLCPYFSLVLSFCRAFSRPDAAQVMQMMCMERDDHKHGEHCSAVSHGVCLFFFLPFLI